LCSIQDLNRPLLDCGKSALVSELGALIRGRASSISNLHSITTEHSKNGGIENWEKYRRKT
jgi:hypothetical protein